MTSSIDVLQKALAEEDIAWCEDWRNGMFTPARTDDGWSVEMHGLVDSHQKLCKAHIALLGEASALDQQVRGFRGVLEQIANSAGRGFDELLRNIARAALRHDAGAGS